MRHWMELKRLQDEWCTDRLKQIKQIPDKAERLRLLIEVEKVSLLSEIAQAITFYHEYQ